MSEQDDKQQPAANVPINGRFDQYRSSFWAAAIAALSLRYGVRPFVRRFWDDDKFIAKDIASKISYAARHSYGTIAGVGMMGVTGFYAYRTYKDIRNIYAEAVAAEFDKKPADVTIHDIWASKNTAVEHTREKFIIYNARRFSVNSIFFLPLVAKYIPFMKKYFTEENGLFGKPVHPESGADWGIAVNGAYLLRDVISRRPTFFESLQTMIDQKVNHADRPDERITGADLFTLYERNLDGKNPELSFNPQRGTPAWDKSMAMFDRMASLMNQSYKNTLVNEKANFGFPQFIFLLGNGLIDPAHTDQACTYMELANKHGLKSVKTVVAAVKRGVPFEQAVATVSPSLELAATPSEPPAPKASFADKVEQKKAPVALPEGLIAQEKLRREQPQNLSGITA